MSRRAVGCVLLAASIGCAPIDVNSEVSVRPREAAPQQFGDAQLDEREFVAEYVQLGPRLLIELREHSSCVDVRHVPVMRVEQIRRTNRGFVIWDFALGTASGAFAALAFAKPQLFSDRLIDGQGRVVYESTGGYIVGGVFAALSVGLLAAGIVDALRSRDTVRYAEAWQVELGPSRACADSKDAGVPLRERALRLRIADELEIETQTDEQGRARFELSSWAGAVPASGQVAAVLEIGRRDGADIESKVLMLSLRVPFEGMVDAHTGVADTRAPADVEPAPIEGPAPAESDSESDSEDPS